MYTENCYKHRKVIIKGRLGSPPCFAGSSSVHSQYHEEYLGHTVCAGDDIDKVNGTVRQPMPFSDAVSFCGYDLRIMKDKTNGKSFYFFSCHDQFYSKDILLIYFSPRVTCSTLFNVSFLLVLLRPGGITNSTEKIFKFYDIIHRGESNIALWWTGIMRFNETHFQNDNSVFTIPNDRLCNDYSSIYPFRKSVVLTLKDGLYTAVS